jgi:L-threo-3-deoxy-hexylosonate aldolase
MKKLLNRRFGYGDKPRRPLTPMAEEKVQEVLDNVFFKSLLEVEASL